MNTKEKNALNTKSEDTTYNSNITREDLEIIGQDFKNNIRKDGGDDVALTNRTHDVDFAGKDLDIPGRNQASKKTTNRLKDEENKLHSQGSSSNENLEEQSKQYTR